MARIVWYNVKHKGGNMKRIIAIILLVASLLTFISCKKNDKKEDVEIVSCTYRSIGYSNFSYKGFLNQVEEHNEDVSEDFFVVAPQDYSVRPGWFLSVSERWIKEESIRKKTVLVQQSFYVCNEEKYGRQVMDWGQYGGFGINFEVEFVSNGVYLPKYDQEIIIKHIFVSEKGNAVDLYQGETCFASMIFMFWDEIPTEENRKIYVENYIRDNVMPHSEYIVRNENGEIKKSDDVFDASDVPQEKQIYTGLGFLCDSNVRDTFEPLAKYGLPFLYLEYIHLEDSNWEGRPLTWPTTEISIYAKDYDDNYNLVEPFFGSKVDIYIDELGGDRVTPIWTNFTVEMVTVPLYIEEFDVELVRLEEISVQITGLPYTSVVNLYYDDFCCATISYYSVGDAVLTTKEERYAYFENYVKTYLRYYNPNEEVEQAN